MILLDTNVLSELMRQEPDRNVIQWMDAQPASDLFICVVTRAEITLGLALLPEGRRRSDLEQLADEMFSGFANRCLPFDGDCVPHYANIVVSRRRAGRPITTEDAQIAAIAMRHNFILATRNRRDFEGIDALGLLDPWTGST